MASFVPPRAVSASPRRFEFLNISARDSGRPSQYRPMQIDRPSSRKRPPGLVSAGSSLVSWVPSLWPAAMLVGQQSGSPSPPLHAQGRAGRRRRVRRRCQNRSRTSVLAHDGAGACAACLLVGLAKNDTIRTLEPDAAGEIWALARDWLATVVAAGGAQYLSPPSRPLTGPPPPPLRDTMEPTPSSTLSLPLTLPSLSVSLTLCASVASTHARPPPGLNVQPIRGNDRVVRAGRAPRPSLPQISAPPSRSERWAAAGVYYLAVLGGGEGCDGGPACLPARPSVWGCLWGGRRPTRCLRCGVFRS